MDRNYFAKKKPAADWNQNVDHARQRKRNRERNVFQNVKPAGETEHHEKNRPPDQWRFESVDPGPRPRAVRIRDFGRAALQQQFAGEHAKHAERELQPGIAEAGWSFTHDVDLGRYPKADWRSEIFSTPDRGASVRDISARIEKSDSTMHACAARRDRAAPARVRDAISDRN